MGTLVVRNELILKFQCKLHDHKSCQKAFNRKLRVRRLTNILGYNLDHFCGQNLDNNYKRPDGC